MRSEYKKRRAFRLKRAKLPQGNILAHYTEDVPSRSNIDRPEAVLRCLVFPFLDLEDLVRPVCKLWVQLATCTMLWKFLYRHWFDVPYTTWHAESTALDWKAAFRSKLVAHRRIGRQRNSFGWKACICPVLGCDKELRNKVELDAHLLKHEQEYCLHRAKRAKGGRRDQLHRKKANKKAI